MRKKTIASIGALGVAATIGAVGPALAADGKVYTLGGYTFSGFAGVDTAELTANLKDQAGARVTQADISIDENMFIAELKAQNIKGHLFATLAKKNEMVWLIFDLQHPDHGAALYSGQPLLSQTFEGANTIPVADLSAATGLKPGDTLSYEKIKVAHDAILALCAKSMPGKTTTVRTRAKVSAKGEISLVWMIGEL